MATTMRASPVPTPTSSAPPTPPYPAFPRLPSSRPGSISRNASTSSSRSTATTSSSTSSLAAVPMRPPPIETRTAATSSSQLPRPDSSCDYMSTSPLNPLSSSSEWGNRSAIRNGPRSRSTAPYSPTLNPTYNPTPERSSTAPPPPLDQHSPTTPRGPKWLPTPDVAPRVTVSEDTVDLDDPIARSPRMSTRGPLAPLAMPRAVRGRDGQWSTPSSPTDRSSSRIPKQRTLSADGRTANVEQSRDRRTSQASAASSGSTPRKPSINDFVLGEELGRGSYSTVVLATSAFNTHASNSPRPPRQYAIKIINQAHLVAEKKVKYAIIERDALIRLAQPSKGHQRVISNSSSTGAPTIRRRSNASITSAAGDIKRPGSVPTPKDRRSVVDGASSSTTPSVPLSPVMKSTLTGRRPSRSAEPPESVPERSEENVNRIMENIRSRPPSPVREESHDGHSTPPARPPTKPDGSPRITTAPPTPDPDSRKPQRSRRQSLAPSEKSAKSARAVPYAHPGIIRLHSTFNDLSSLYFVLDLAKNGELLGFIRKYGSLDVGSARYYAAQLIDTIEFMHERGVIHRDLKPENILLDEAMRIKITDFGSAKIVGREADAQDNGRKRSFVGSADFVSPEVLRSEPADFASDTWAFGCILYQLLVGKPPFRGATDYLTFQKILKRDITYPDDMDESARSLIDLVLNVDPSARPTPAEIKQHPFFVPIDFSSLWQISAPPISSGLTKPVQTLASAPPDSNVWAVFDDEVSDGGFEYDDGETPSPRAADREHAAEPRYDRRAAADAVDIVDSAQGRRMSNRQNRRESDGSLEPPRPSFVDGERKKGRNWSTVSRSARTSSSSSNNRTALTGLLETIGIHPTGSPAQSIHGGTPRSTRNSRASDEARMSVPVSEPDSKWSSLLLSREKIIYTSPISVRPNTSAASSFLPSFLLPAAKRRQLILTDFPRLIEVKDVKDDGREDTPGQGRIKFEAVFVKQAEAQPTAADYAAVGLPSSPSQTALHGGSNRVVDVSERGSKGFIVNTVGSSVMYQADSAEIRDHWLEALRGVQA